MTLKFKSKNLVGTNRDGRVFQLMKIDQVEHYNPVGSIDSFLRLILINDKEDCSDSFYFSLDKDMELRYSFLQTTEANMKLLEWEMALIQQQPRLNKFINTICHRYFNKERKLNEFKII